MAPLTPKCSRRSFPPTSTVAGHGGVDVCPGCVGSGVPPTTTPHEVRRFVPGSRRVLCVNRCRAGLAQAGAHMANELTGGFEVIAEFTVPVAARGLAAIRRGNRPPHPLSIRVDPRRVLSPDAAQTAFDSRGGGPLRSRSPLPEHWSRRTSGRGRSFQPAPGTSLLDQRVNTLDAVTFLTMTVLPPQFSLG